MDEEEGRADEERARDGKAVGGGEVLRGTEEQQDGHDPDEERPVDHGHVDLSPLQARGVPDGEARNIAEAPCRDTEKAPEMTACEAMIVATVDSITGGNPRASGARWKKGLPAAGGSSRIRAPWPR